MKNKKLYFAPVSKSLVNEFYEANYVSRPVVEKLMKKHFPELAALPDEARARVLDSYFFTMKLFRVHTLGRIEKALPDWKEACRRIDLYLRDVEPRIPEELAKLSARKKKRFKDFMYFSADLCRRAVMDMIKAYRYAEPAHICCYISHELAERNFEF